MWVYGDRRVYDLVRQYDVPADLAEMTRFTGYLDPLDPTLPAGNGAECEKAIDDLDLQRSRLALCLVGGGRDGVALAEAFLRAELPRDMAGLVITGPLMPADARAHLERLLEGTPSRRLLPFVTDPLPFVRRADRLVAMGGYNTMCEIVPRDVPTLVVPRVHPRTEQLLRARRFAHLGLVACLHPDRLSPQAVTEWLAHDPRGAPRRADIDFGGIARLPQLMSEVFHAIDTDRCNLAG
jgi:predicted glycosyltransferase